MELTQLRYFQKVAHTQSITRAAMELNVAQPTLSQSLRRLENSLGCPLFNHTPGKRLELNHTGVLFLEKVDRAIAELEQGVQLVQEYSSLTHSHVYFASAIQELSCEIVMSFLKESPNIRVSQHLSPINSLPEMLTSEEIDFALSPCPLTEFDPRIESLPLYNEEFFAVVGPQHPFASRKIIHRDELVGQRFICNYAESDRTFLTQILGCKNPDVDIMLQSDEPLVIRRTLQESTCVAFMPGRVVMRRLETGDPLMQHPIRILGCKNTIPTCISKKKNRVLDAAAAELYQFVIDYCRRESEMVEYFLESYFPEGKTDQTDEF